MFTNENNLHTIPRELLSISVFINDDLLGMKVIKLVPLYFQCNFVHENLEKKAIEKQVFWENLHTNAYDKTRIDTHDASLQRSMTAVPLITPITFTSTPLSNPSNKRGGGLLPL